MRSYLLVVDTIPSRAMQFRLFQLLEQQGVMKEECILLPLLGNEKPEGAQSKISTPQLHRLLPAFRNALMTQRADAVITCGGAAFRAVTGLRWDHTKVAGYILFPSDCVPIEMKQRVQIGVYANSNKANGITKGDPKFAMRSVPQDPVLPIGCRIIVPSITIENVIKMRFKNISQFRAAFRNCREILEGQPLLDDSFTFEDKLPPVMECHIDDVVAYDLEVPRDSTAVERASISGPKGTWSLPWTEFVKEFFQFHFDIAALRVAHNQQFDIPILRAHGIDVPEPTFDTMIAAGIIEPDLLKGLQAVAPIYLRLKPWKHLSEVRGFADPEYNAKDSFVERQLALVLIAELKGLEMYDLFMDRVMPSVSVLMDMSQRGIRIHPGRATDWCAKLETELQQAQEEWNALYPQVNTRSPKQLANLFYKTWNISPIRRKGDGIRTDEYAIRTLASRYPEHREALGILLRIREGAKDLSTYGRTALGVDFVHPSYLPVGKDGTERGEGKRKGMAATGRIAASNPNIQNQPPSARLMYIPDTPNDVFIEFDWSQAELRIAAVLSGDTTMLHALETDIHAYTMKIMGCDRTRAKNTLYGSAYGAGAKKLKETLEEHGFATTIKECEELQAGLARSFPRWWAWRDTISARGSAEEYLRNPFGRIRRFPMGAADTPAMLDYLPQSTVGDMSWTVYRPLHETAKSFGGRLTTAVHDSFLLQVPKENVERALIAFQRILEQPFHEVGPNFIIPTTVKVGAPGASWGELEKP